MSEWTMADAKFEAAMAEMEDDLQWGAIDCHECGEAAVEMQYGQPVCHECKWIIGG